MKLRAYNVMIFLTITSIFAVNLSALDYRVSIVNDKNGWNLISHDQGQSERIVYSSTYRMEFPVWSNNHEYLALLIKGIPIQAHSSNDNFSPRLFTVRQPNKM